MAAGKPTVRDSNFVSYKCSDAAILPGKIVQVDTTNTDNQETVVKAATASTNKVIGIATTETTAANQEVTIQIGGICKVNAKGDGTAISEGDYLIPTTAGQAIKIATEDATNQYTVGMALQPSAADGDFIPVLLNFLAINKGTA
jgi:hypothetical protein